MNYICFLDYGVLLTRMRNNLSNITAGITIGLLFGTLFLGCSRLDSVTIIWSRPGTGTGLATGMAIGDEFLYIVASDRSRYAKYGRWHIEKRRVKDGLIEPSFGSLGVVSGAEEMGSSRSIAVDSQYMYVIGDDNGPGIDDSQWRIEKRILLNGSLVSGFGNGGVVASNPTPKQDVPHAIAIDADYMYIVGTETTIRQLSDDEYIHDMQWRIEKRNLSDGAPVSNFGDGGFVTVNPSEISGRAGLESPNAIAVDAEFMYVAGAAYKKAPFDMIWRIEKRRLTDGSLCTEFGNGGVVTSDPGPGHDELYSLAVDDEFMYLVGHDTSPDNAADQRWRVEKRSLKDGALDTGFGNGGVATDNPGNLDDRAYAVALDKKSSLWQRISYLDIFGGGPAMYVVGNNETQGKNNKRWLIEKRRMSDGKLEAEFGRDGILTASSAIYHTAREITADADYIYICVYDYINGVYSPAWRIVKVKK